MAHFPLRQCFLKPHGEPSAAGLVDMQLPVLGLKQKSCAQTLWSWKQALVPRSAWHCPFSVMLAPGRLLGPGRGWFELWGVLYRQEAVDVLKKCFICLMEQSDHCRPLDVRLKSLIMYPSFQGQAFAPGELRR